MRIIKIFVGLLASIFANIEPAIAAKYICGNCSRSLTVATAWG
jgi:hypothetical protein